MDYKLFENMNKNKDCFKQIAFFITMAASLKTQFSVNQKTLHGTFMQSSK
jgi:hypothetical protein